MSLAHFRQRLCWQGSITTGFVNISRQMGQISCFSKLSILIWRAAASLKLRMRPFGIEKIKLSQFLYTRWKQALSIAQPPVCSLCNEAWHSPRRGPLSARAVFRKPHVRGCYVYLPKYENDTVDSTCIS